MLLRLLNASATENVVLALPGHSFKIIAMDGIQSRIPSLWMCSHWRSPSAWMLLSR